MYGSGPPVLYNDFLLVSKHVETTLVVDVESKEKYVDCYEEFLRKSH